MAARQQQPHHGSSGMMVAESAVSALNTETVMYMLRQYAAQQQQRTATRTEEGGGDDSVVVAGSGTPPPESSGAARGAAAATSSTSSGSSSTTMYHGLEEMGYMTGFKAAEFLLQSEPLANYTPQEASKFIGGTVWRAIFSKRVDKMRHKDNVYFELKDFNFKWMRCTSVKQTAPSPAMETTHVAPGFTQDGALTTRPPAQPRATTSGDATAAATAPPPRPTAVPKDFLVYPVGVIRGVLEALGHRHVIISTNVVTGCEVHFVLDFRQATRI